MPPNTVNQSPAISTVRLYKAKAHLLLSTIESNNTQIEGELGHELDHITFLEKILSNLQSAVSKLRIARNKHVIGMVSSRGGQSELSSSKSISRSGIFEDKGRNKRSLFINRINQIRKMKKRTRLKDRRRMKTLGYNSLCITSGIDSNIDYANRTTFNSGTCIIEKSHPKIMTRNRLAKSRSVITDDPKKYSFKMYKKIRDAIDPHSGANTGETDNDSGESEVRYVRNLDYAKPTNLDSYILSEDFESERGDKVQIQETIPEN